MDEQKRSYEERLQRLQTIVSKIENEVLPLEETLALYKEGQALVMELGAELSEAEKLVAQQEIK